MLELTTPRLTLRPYRAEDYPLLRGITSDLRVFFWYDEPMPEERTREILDNSLELTRTRGLGWWAAFEQAGGAFVGNGMLQVLPETGEIEIGYHFLPEFQGKGYATEAAGALLDYGFRDAGLERIVAVVLPDNKPSQAVMKKLGLPYIKDLTKAGLLHNYFALSREDYLCCQDPVTP